MCILLHIIFKFTREGNLSFYESYFYYNNFDYMEGKNGGAK